MKKYIKSVLGFIILQIIFSAFSNLALAFMPYFIKLLFDTVTSGNIISILWLCAGYASCVLLSLIFSYMDQYFMWRTAIKFEGALKRDFFTAVSAYRYIRFKKYDVGEYIGIQGNEIQELEMDYLTPLVSIFKSIMSLIVYAIVLFAFIDWRIGIVIVSVSVVTALFAPKVLTKPLSNRRKLFLDRKGLYIAKMKDLLEGFKLIKTTTRNALLAEHEQELRKTLDLRFSYGKLKVLMLVFNGFFLYLLNIVSFIIVGLMMYMKEISIGAGIATLGYIESFIDPIRDITMNISSIRSTSEIKNKVLEFLEPENKVDLLLLTEFKKSIEFHGVCTVFDDFAFGPIDLKFEKGKKYALLGHNGSGKSTVLNLIMQYTEPREGEILFDGFPLKDIDTSKVIWNVDQNDHMYAVDFQNCVTVFSALKQKRLEELEIAAGTKKIKTLSESSNCQDLSGGEKQLVSIARAMLANTDVVLFDESFAAMDPTTHEKVHELVLKDRSKTVISVTHKITEHLELYDEVIILKDGRVVAKGPWSVVKMNDIYLKEFAL